MLRLEASAHADRLEPLRPLAALAVRLLALRTSAVLLTLVLLAVMTVRAAQRCIAATTIGTGFRRPRAMGLLLLALMLATGVAVLRRGAMIVVTAALALLGVRVRMTVTRLARPVLAVAVALAAMVAMVGILALRLSGARLGPLMASLPVRLGMRMSVTVTPAPRLVGAHAILAMPTLR